MTENELRVQIALGSFPEDRITPKFIQECQSPLVLKLIAKLWITSVKHTDTSLADTITNLLLYHNMATPKLRQYVLTGRLYQQAVKNAQHPQLGKCGFNFQEHYLKALDTLEQELFGN